MKEFMTYTNYLNLNETSLRVPINITKVVEVAEPVIGETANLTSTLVTTAKETVVGLANSTLDLIEEIEGLIEAIPLQNVSDVVAWDALAELMEALGFDEYVEVEDIEAFLEEIEDVL